MSMDNLAVTLDAQGDRAAARGLQEDLLEAQRRVLGEDHPDTLSSMSHVAVTLHFQGNLAAGRALQERALGALRRVVGDRHERSTVAAWNLFRMLLDSGDAQALWTSQWMHCCGCARLIRPN